MALIAPPRAARTAMGKPPGAARRVRQATAADHVVDLGARVVRSDGSDAAPDARVRCDQFLKHLHEGCIDGVHVDARAASAAAVDAVRETVDAPELHGTRPVGAETLEQSLEHPRQRPDEGHEGNRLDRADVGACTALHCLHGRTRATSAADE